MAARTLAVCLQNRFLQDHLVHYAIVYRPTKGKRKKLERNFFFITDPNHSCSHGVPYLAANIRFFITDPNLSCSHGVSISYSVIFSVQMVYLAANIMFFNRSKYFLFTRCIYQLQCNLFCSDGIPVSSSSY